MDSDGSKSDKKLFADVRVMKPTLPDYLCDYFYCYELNSAYFQSEEGSDQHNLHWPHLQCSVDLFQAYLMSFLMLVHG